MSIECDLYGQTDDPLLNKFPPAQPLPEAVQAGLFGMSEDGAIWPTDEDVVVLTQEHARQMLNLLCQIAELETAEHLGVYPDSRRRPRTAEQYENLHQTIQVRLADCRDRYHGYRSAYASGFGYHAADALDASLQEIMGVDSVESIQRTLL